MKLILKEREKKTNVALLNEAERELFDEQQLPPEKTHVPFLRVQNKHKRANEDLST